MAAGSSGWTPLSLSPTLWLDASDAATITSSGGAVSAWANKGSAGGSFDQATAAAKPTTGATTQNGHNVITFDGTDDLLTLDLGSDSFSATSWYLWVVAKADAGGFYPRVLAGHVAATGTWDFESSNAIFAFLDAASTGASASRVGGYSAGTAGATTAAHMGVSAYRVIGSRRHSGSIYSHLAGTLTAGTVASAPASLRYLRIGGFNTTLGLEAGWKGGVAEMVMTADGNPSAGDVTAMSDYLTAKWAVY